MKKLITVILAILFLASPAYAYDGHDDPPKDSHHYAALSAGCDLGYDHEGAHDSQAASLSLFVSGTCTQADKALADACGRALPGFIADDLNGYWADMLACPAGQDPDSSGKDVFYEHLYRAYVLFVQGI
jgi:hypothetical protein